MSQFLRFKIKLNTYDLISGDLIEFTRRGIFVIENIPGEFNNSALKSQTNTQIGSFICSRPIRCGDHAFGTTSSKPARN